jgi:hypothetical protein
MAYILLAETHSRSIRQSSKLSLDERQCGKDGHSGKAGGLENHLGGSRTRWLGSGTSEGRCRNAKLWEGLSSVKCGRAVV